MSAWYMEQKAFQGRLSIEAHALDVSFNAGIDRSGKLVIAMDRFPITQESTFVYERWDPPGIDFGAFTLTGKAEDGTTLKTLDLIFTTMGDQTFQNEWSVEPAASCSRAELRLTRDDLQGPCVRMLVKGFENLRDLREATSLGEVSMAGAHKDDGDDQMSGLITISTAQLVDDVVKWRDDVDRLFKHIRYVMSFAAGTMLTAPIVEFIHNGATSITVLSQSKRGATGMAPFSSRDHVAIFKAAIASHFAPPFEVQNLHFAIEWFAMRSVYCEANLISAMTVLENLISSNLTDDDTFIRPNEEFKQFKKKLSAVVKRDVASWTDDENEQQRIIGEFSVKFNDLNRRSLKQKIDLLAQRWGVDLFGLHDDKIKAAKKARDLIVHRGTYGPADGELITHVFIARELVVRFILTALGFEGRYYSYLGGWHERQFARGERD